MRLIRRRQLTCIVIVLLLFSDWPLAPVRGMIDDARPQAIERVGRAHQQQSAADHCARIDQQHQSGGRAPLGRGGADHRARKWLGVDGCESDRW